MLYSNTIANIYCYIDLNTRLILTEHSSVFPAGIILCMNKKCKKKTHFPISSLLKKINIFLLYK